MYTGLNAFIHTGLNAFVYIGLNAFLYTDSNAISGQSLLVWGRKETQ